MADDLSDLKIAFLCDLLQVPDANLKAYKRTVLSQLIAKSLVEPASGVDPQGRIDLKTILRAQAEAGMARGEVARTHVELAV